MASSYSKENGLEEKEVFNIHLVSNEIKQPIFKAIPDIAYKQDHSGALSMIPL